MPLLANSPDQLVVLQAIAVAFGIPGFALITLIVNALWGRRRWWGFLMGLLAAIATGWLFWYTHSGDDSSSWHVQVHGPWILSAIFTGCGLLLWMRRTRGVA